MVPAWIPKAVDVVAQGLPVAGGLYTAGKALIGLGDSTGAAGTQSGDAAMQAARNQLAAGLAAKFTKGPQGNSFDARFWNFATQSPEDATKSTTNSYDRAIQGIKDQIDQLSLEAQGASKTSQAVQELKTAHDLNQAAMKAGITVTDEMRAKWKDYADQIAELNIQIRQQQALQSEQFKGATMFMSPADQAAANVAYSIDPKNWQAHMSDLAAQTAAFNQEIGQARDLTLTFFDSFNNDIINGTVSMSTLTNAVKGLANTLLQMAEKNLVNAAFGGLFGGATTGGGLFSGLGHLFGLKDGGSFVVPAGAGAMALPGFANGTDWTVPGSGGPDSKVTAFRVSPGERVTVTPPGRGVGAGPTIVMGGNTYNFPTNADPAFRAQMKAYVDQSHKNAVAEAVTTFARVYGNTPKLLQGK